MRRVSGDAGVVVAQSISGQEIAPSRGMLRRTPQAILFDLDGTLVDSVPDLARCVNAALVDVGAPAASEARIRSWVGNGASRLLHRALTGHANGIATAQQHASAMAVFNACYAQEPCRDSGLYPGVSATLAALVAQGISLGCVTNKPHRFVRPLLEALGLGDCFASLIGGDSTPRLKPDPLPVQAALAELGVPASQSLLVGDSHVDMAAGQAAGVATVAVSYGYDSGCDFRALGALAVLDRLTDLPTVWGRPAVAG